MGDRSFQIFNRHWKKISIKLRSISVGVEQNHPIGNRSSPTVSKGRRLRSPLKVADRRLQSPLEDAGVGGHIHPLTRTTQISDFLGRLNKNVRHAKYNSNILMYKL